MWGPQYECVGMDPRKGADARIIVASASGKKVAHIPGTTNTFTGSATTEYGARLFLSLQTGRHSVGFFVNDNRQIVNHNPCALDLNGSSRGNVPELIDRGQ